MAWKEKKQIKNIFFRETFRIFFLNLWVCLYLPRTCPPGIGAVFGNFGGAGSGVVIWVWGGSDYKYNGSYDYEDFVFDFNDLWDAANADKN